MRGDGQQARISTAKRRDASRATKSFSPRSKISKKFLIGEFSVASNVKDKDKRTLISLSQDEAFFKNDGP